MQTDASRERPARDRFGSGRLAPVLTLLSDELSARGGGAGVSRVLDCGGGSGTFAVPLAASGAHVTVVDISADALATLTRRADEARVSELVQAIQGDVEALAGLLPTDGYDLVLAHGILEAVDDVSAAFAGITSAVRPGGLLSLIVDNPIAAVVARALAGELDDALAELDALDVIDVGTGPDVVAGMCTEAGLAITVRQGIGVFADLVPGAVLDRAGARDTLARLDLAAARRSPFVDIAGRIHLLARRPGAA